MGNPRGYIEVKRKEAGNRPVEERIDDFGEVEQTLNTEDRKLQASRCMDCGVPFCHWACPVSSLVPEWQHALYKGNWQEASEILHRTNEFPEFTGRICPAPCEKSCVLSIHDEAVTIRENEASIIERAFENGLIVPRPPKKRTGKNVAVIGSGPAGLTIAARLNRLGHKVVVYEKQRKAGGLLRYGIPDFKLNKKFIDRRLEIFLKEGVEIHNGVNVGADVSAQQLLDRYDAVVLAVGAMKPRDIEVKGRGLKGVFFAMDYLVQQNRVIDGEVFPEDERILATDKHVVVVGGGDTGSDCVGTAVRQKAASVTQIEILPEPPQLRLPDNPWPFWPITLKTSSSHGEGCKRLWSMETCSFEGNGSVKALRLAPLNWTRNSEGKWSKEKIDGEELIVPAELVLLAMGFMSPLYDTLLNEMGILPGEHNNLRVDGNHRTNIPKVFAAGDAVSGAGLVVRAIADALHATITIHDYLSS